MTFEGTARGRLFFDRNGTPVREIDNASQLNATLTSPYDSVTFPLGSIHTEYLGDEEGNVTVGSPAIVTFTGFCLNARRPSAGIVVFPAVVVDFVDDVIPFIELDGPPTFVAGRTVDVEALCEALQ